MCIVRSYFRHCLDGEACKDSRVAIHSLRQRKSRLPNETLCLSYPSPTMVMNITDVSTVTVFSFLRSENPK